MYIQCEFWGFESIYCWRHGKVFLLLSFECPVQLLLLLLIQKEQQQQQHCIGIQKNTVAAAVIIIATAGSGGGSGGGGKQPRGMRDRRLLLLLRRSRHTTTTATRRSHFWSPPSSQEAHKMRQESLLPPTKLLSKCHASKVARPPGLLLQGFPWDIMNAQPKKIPSGHCESSIGRSRKQEKSRHANKHAACWRFTKVEEQTGRCLLLSTCLSWQQSHRSRCSHSLSQADDYRLLLLLPLLVLVLQSLFRKPDFGSIHKGDFFTHNFMVLCSVGMTIIQPCNGDDRRIYILSSA